MKEFGSDFHFELKEKTSSKSKIGNDEALFYAVGRQAIQDLIENNSWKRIWIPEYFCYEIIEAIEETGIEVKLYPDAPTLNDNFIISQITFEKHDVLLRMNFFGLRLWRDNSSISIDVIEDHSHDLFGTWASTSNADWCFASLRKTLPIPEGGILWSPQKKILPNKLLSTTENDLISYKRVTAMLIKKLYLLNEIESKELFRKLFIETEEDFSNLGKSSISNITNIMLSQIDIEGWYRSKQRNWLYLFSKLKNYINILIPENIEECNPFSLILKFDNHLQRELFRLSLIEKNIYPAILWSIPDSCNPEITKMSDRLLSIHCDGRYNSKEVQILKKIILETKYKLDKNNELF